MLRSSTNASPGGAGAGGSFFIDASAGTVTAPAPSRCAAVPAQRLTGGSAAAAEEAAAEPPDHRADGGTQLATFVEGGRAALPAAAAASAAKPEVPECSSDPERPFTAPDSRCNDRRTAGLPARGSCPGCCPAAFPTPHSPMEAMPPIHRSLSLLISSALATTAALAAQTQEKIPVGSVGRRAQSRRSPTCRCISKPNQGQTKPGEIPFRGAGRTLFLTQSKAVLLVTRFERRPLENLEHRTTDERTVLEMSFIGASRNSKSWDRRSCRARSITWLEATLEPGETNIPPTPGSPIAICTRHRSDLLRSRRQLEYDFVVRPGADLRRILVRFSGAEKLEVDAQGDLLLRTGPDVIRQRKPIAYQEVNGMRREVPVSYVLKGARRVAFKVAAHDSGRR